MGRVRGSGELGRRIRVFAVGWILVCSGMLAGPDRAGAEASAAPSGRGFFRCDVRHADFRAFARSDASLDVAHGLIWLGGGAAISLGTNPSRRWTRENDFDAGIQSAIRIDGAEARRDADSASDFFAALGAGMLPFAAIGSQFARTHDCIETWDMVGEAFESISLALFVSEAIKVASGRERPFGDRCPHQPPRDADCRKDDRNLSFVSGHATLAAAGTGVACRFAWERRAFGAGPWARIAPCALGIASALTAGTLRMASDRHWTTDVLVGFGVGALVGAFDVPGPLEWLRVERRDAEDRLSSRGMLLPLAREGRLGAQWTMFY